MRRSLTIDMGPVYSGIGLLLLFLAGVMTLPAFADLQAGNSDWRVFATTAALTLFTGVGLWLTGGRRQFELSTRHAIILVALVWVIVPAVGALPFFMSSLDLSLTDAYFEAVSGLTTTGSTVLTGLDKLPPGILIWRGALQWFGGLGIIVMAIGLLPRLQIGGMQMFRVEAFETFGKALPRVRQISVHITIIFVILTLSLFVALKLAGLSSLDAVVHAMTTIATGGYSTYDDSIHHFDSALVDGIISLGMFLGGIPFILYLKLTHGDRSIFTDEQVRFYTKILLISIGAVGLWLYFNQGFDAGESLRFATFNVVSIMTGTGYVSADYGQWGGFPIIVLAALTFLGGCAGSTACGIKVFRIQIILRAAATQVRRLIYPNAIFKLQFNGHPVDASMVVSVSAVLFAFLASFIVLSAGLATAGLDVETALSSAATAISNVGPGFGEIVGPSGTFQPLPDSAKWMLVVGMLLGRLEFLTFLTLLSPLFWRH